MNAAFLLIYECVLHVGFFWLCTVTCSILIPATVFLRWVSRLLLQFGYQKDSKKHVICFFGASTYFSEHVIHELLNAGHNTLLIHHDEELLRNLRRNSLDLVDQKPSAGILHGVNTSGSEESFHTRLQDILSHLKVKELSLVYVVPFREGETRFMDKDFANTFQSFTDQLGRIWNICESRSLTPGRLMILENEFSKADFSDTHSHRLIQVYQQCNFDRFRSFRDHWNANNENASNAKNECDIVRVVVPSYECVESALHPGKRSEEADSTKDGTISAPETEQEKVDSKVEPKNIAACDPVAPSVTVNGQSDTQFAQFEANTSEILSILSATVLGFDEYHPGSSQFSLFEESIRRCCPNYFSLKWKIFIPLLGVFSRLYDFSVKACNKLLLRS